MRQAETRRAWRYMVAAGMVLMLGAACTTQPGAGDKGAPEPRGLERGFADPPRDARPQAWWHWMNGNVTRKGALLDLEWLNRMGIGGVHIFSGALSEPLVVDEPAPFLSEIWSDAFRAAVTKARAAGMEVTVAASPGWSQTGGPWVAPEDAMKKYVWSEKVVQGGEPVGLLPALPVTTGPFMGVPKKISPFASGSQAPLPEAYGDSAVFAFRNSHVPIVPASYASSSGPLPAMSELLRDLSQSVSLTVPDDGERPFLDIRFDEVETFRSLTVSMDVWPGFEILAKGEDGEFARIAEVSPVDAEYPAPQQSYNFPPAASDHFRIVLNRPSPPRRLPDLPDFIPVAPAPSEILVRWLEFSREARVQRFESKAGFEPAADFDGDRTRLEAAAVPVKREEVVDLSGLVSEDGSVEWVPPAGSWTIVRLGWSLTGSQNGPAEPEATGFEVDKLSREAVQLYARELFSLYEQHTGVQVGPEGITHLLTDSWEAGVQNWTPEMLAEFQSRRGYSAVPWLPVLTGRIVQSAEASDAFLFDFRRTLAEMLADHHYTTLAELSHSLGITYYTEAQGDTPRAIMDGYSAKARADIPTAEFWYRPFATAPGQPTLVTDIREAASVASIYGKPFVAVESFTVAAGNDPWAFSPAMLRPVADRIFAYGGNRILIHESHLQPFEGKAPGLMLAIFGQFFNRHDTWAEAARPWTDYLARASFLLQQGKRVADVAVFYGEEVSLTQRYHRAYEDPVPPGFAFDFVSSEALHSALDVVDGKLTSAGGGSYKILYIPPYVNRISSETLSRIEVLVRAGAILVADRPAGGLGLRDIEDGAAGQIDRIWGQSVGPPRRVGAGKVYPSSDIEAALKAEGVAPAILVPDGAEILFQHRRTEGYDIFFVVNSGDETLPMPLSLRASGSGELWDAATGRLKLMSYRQVAGRTEVQLALAPGESAFLVISPSPVAQREVPVPVVLAEVPVIGPWLVRFQDGRGAPESKVFNTLQDWSLSEDAGIRHFSGGAAYQLDIDITPQMLSPGTRLYLDLGEVYELAVVRINGEDVATAWKAPYRIDLTDALTAGRHGLEIEVFNLWVNRLIGDRQPDAAPVAFAPQSTYTSDSRLLPSGLVGPVRLIVMSDPEKPE